MALERDRLRQACRGVGRLRPNGAARITKRTSRSASFRSTPARGAGSSDAGSAGRLRARPKRHDTGSSYSSRNRFTGVVRLVANDGVMAWVEIEAGPPSDRSDHARRDGGTRTRPRRTGDGRREGDLRHDQAHPRRSIWASRMRLTCGLVIGAPSVPDWATSNGLARPPLSVRSSRVRARPASLAPQYFKPVAFGDLLSARKAGLARRRSRSTSERFRASPPVAPRSAPRPSQVER